jgi:single-strand DNA-binding protein
MAQGDVQITVVGNLTADPELRFTANGLAVVNFTVASTSRAFDKASNEWKDGDTVFLRCSVWRQYAENVAESLTKGTRVMVTGRLKVRQYEARDGSKGTSVECEVDDVGPVLRNATAKVTRVSRGEGGFGGGNAAAAPADDPWATPAPSGGGDGGWGAPAAEEPPF